jgi:drug/metabolite transporter (DMT)-like permease
MKRRSQAELALAVVTAIWGSTFVVVKNALADISPILFITARFVLAAVVLAAIYRPKINTQIMKAGTLAGALLFFAYASQTVGLGYTTPSKSAFLTSLSIPMVPLASSLVYKARPRFFEGVGILIASIGMILMTFPASRATGNFEIGKGEILSLLCAVLFAIHIVVVAHYAPLIGFQPLAVVQITMAALFGLVLFWFVEPIRFHWTTPVAVAVLTTGLLATALAFTTMAWAQQYTSATRSAIIFALEPVVAWVTSYFVYGEVMTGRGMLGALLILGGILVVELKPSMLKRTSHGEHPIL